MLAIFETICYTILCIGLRVEHSALSRFFSFYEVVSVLMVLAETTEK